MKKTGRKILLIILLLALTAGLMLADSNSRIVVTEYVSRSDSLPEGFEGFTIVQLSDIHGRDFGGRLAEKTAELEPDIIVITGDLADRDTDMELVDSLLAELTHTAPVYYISGNHEWGEGLITQVKTLLEKHGVTYLSNSYVTLQAGDDEIILAGVEDPNSMSGMPAPDEVVEGIRDAEGDKFTVLLGHRNYWAEKYPDLEVDIIICGHAHGGIVRLPFVGGVLGTGFEFFPDYVDGMHAVGQYELVISRGLGNSAGIPRFLNNPEIVVLTLEGQNG